MLVVVTIGSKLKQFGSLQVFATLMKDQIFKNIISLPLFF